MEANHPWLRTTDRKATLLWIIQRSQGEKAVDTNCLWFQVGAERGWDWREGSVGERISWTRGLSWSGPLPLPLRNWFIQPVNKYAKYRNLLFRFVGSGQFQSSPEGFLRPLRILTLTQTNQDLEIFFLKNKVLLLKNPPSKAQSQNSSPAS